MKHVAEIAPPNSLLLITAPAPSIGEIPEIPRGPVVVATSSCVAVGTLMQYDGETRITLTDEPSQADDSAPAYDGEIATPDHKLAVCTVLLETVVEIGVPSTTARVRVWTNDPSEPDQILVLVS